MNKTKRIAAAATEAKAGATRNSAEKILAWLDSGGRNVVQNAVKKAILQTEARNKARELDPDILDRRVTF